MTTRFATAPKLNTACLRLARIAATRDDAAEQAVAGKSPQVLDDDCTVTTSADRLLVDTNVLAYASLRNSPWHSHAIQALHTVLQSGKKERGVHGGVLDAAECPDRRATCTEARHPQPGRPKHWCDHALRLRPPWPACGATF